MSNTEFVTVQWQNNPYSDGAIDNTIGTWTYGNWGGQGWSGGKFLKPGERPDFENVLGKNDLDNIFKIHDKSYWDIQQAWETSGKTSADIAQYWQSTMAADNAMRESIKELKLNNGWGDTPLGSDVPDFNMANAALQAERAFALKNFNNLAALQNLKNPDGISDDPYSGDPFTGLPWAGQSYETLLTNLETRFQQAEVTRSPLVLDLDGDGVETTLSSKTGVHFDLDKSGFAEQAGWVGKDDGLLVRDLNGDGKITHGGELFGNHTVLKSGSQAANGFEALKDLDDNNDGKVDANDSAYASLRVWKDLNSDGVTEDGELITLEQAGVQSLNVRYTDQGTSATKDAQGNQHQQLGSYTKADGSTQQMDDVWFSVDTARTVNLNTVTVSDEIAALPDVADNDKHWRHAA
ncbi:hypothetical protein B9Z39_02460 [Limnohabitans sp. JirII-29]|uniref:hypothetical protein n=1 Tax=Limnohabitans sp. JirII-29 TaxID=1835756 RepID=UPI000D398921|nr:hypothetical protein [Limnohabitans sp. JirII-29]PUE30394.1 hypothetical protein B9Z39_02460 [Limnohabitans sp. JirII-29]